jgi:hypothetical protein
LTGYAYETLPNKPIVTGITHDDSQIPQASLMQPAPEKDGVIFPMLGALALGADGIAIWRREKG